VGQDTEPHSLLGQLPVSDDRALPARSRPRSEIGHRQGGDNATVQTPIQRDDSDPRVDELFGDAGDSTDGPSTLSGPQAANLTAPTLPAARRPTQPPQSPPRAAPPAASQGPPTSSAGQQTAPTAPIGPTVSAVETEPGGGGSVLRWLVVVLLIGAGAAVGIFLGQMLI
jgi:hypothetical protein